jgi:hypothetical protein
MGAILTAAQLINMMPSRVLEWKSPYEMLKGDNGGILPLKVFGCVCFVKDNRPSVGKLYLRAVKCVFVGYSTTQKGYVCWSPVKKRLFVSMDVHFREFEPYYTQEVSSPFGDSVDTTGIRQEGKNGEIMVNVGSIPLSLPSSIEEQENDEEEVEPVCVGTQTQEEMRHVYERRKKQNEGPVPLVSSSPLSPSTSTPETPLLSSDSEYTTM